MELGTDPDLRMRRGAVLNAFVLNQIVTHMAHVRTFYRAGDARF